ncbi:hypothetical protein R1flu_028040 [Riccia fluitans]|uniref:Uncharacterized protein n=1 Tax=Riccia fluitans TaxID=41844 RepID=A0ABD1XKK0_9MARC
MPIESMTQLMEKRKGKREKIFSASTHLRIAAASSSPKRDLQAMEVQVQEEFSDEVSSGRSSFTCRDYLRTPSGEQTYGTPKMAHADPEDDCHADSGLKKEDKCEYLNRSPEVHHEDNEGENGPESNDFASSESNLALPRTKVPEEYGILSLWNVPCNDGPDQSRNYHTLSEYLLVSTGSNAFDKLFKSSNR